MTISARAIGPTTSALPDPLLLSDGTAGAPTYSYASDTNTGMYLFGTDRIGFTAAGVERVTIGGANADFSVQILGSASSGVGSPSYAFDNDPDTGIYRAAADTLGFATSGTAQLTLSSSTADFQDNDITTTGTITGSIIDTLMVVTAAGPYNVTASDQIIIINQTVGAAITVNLPAIGTTGRQLIIKDGKGDAGTNNITIDGDSGETIDALTTQVLNGDYWSMSLVDNGTEWSIS